MEIDARLLRSFLAVAEERHFGRAAARVHLTSPALSQQVRRLERIVGARLFERDSRHVELTAAGTALVPVAAEVVRAADAAAAAVARIRRAARPVVDVGYLAASGQLLPRLREVLAGHGVVVQGRRLEWGEQTSAVREGRVDAAFARSPVADDGLHLLPVLSEPRVAGLWADHPLADRASLSIADLAGEALVSSTTAPERWRRFWHVDPRPDGSPVRRGPAVENTDEMLEVVAARRAVCITAASVPGYYRHPGVVFVPVDDIAESEVVLCWARDDRRDALQLLVGAVRTLLAARS